MNTPIAGALRDRRAVERRLDESESFFRALFENAAVAGAIVETGGQLRQVNAAFTKMFGYSQAEALGLTVESITHPDDLKQTREQNFAVSSGQRSETRYEKRYRHKDGHTLWAIVTVSRFEQNGRSLMLGQILDVTEQHQILEALGQAHMSLTASEGRVQALLENISDVIAVLAPDGLVSFISDGVRSTLGYEPSDVLAKPFGAFIHPDDQPRASERFGKLLQLPGQSLRGDYRLRAADGSWREFEVVSRNLITVPAVGGIVIVMRDVSERSAYHAVRDRLAAMIEGSNEAIIGTTLTGMITDWNAAAERFYGYDRHEIVGRSVSMLVAPEGDVTAEVGDRIRRMAAGETIKNVGGISVRKDGSRFAYDLSLSYIRDSNGVPTGIMAVVQDVSAHRELELRLQLFRKLIDRAGDGIEVLDPVSHRFLDVNAEACRELGYRRDELLNMTVFDIDPTVSKEQLRALDEPLRNGEVVVLETVHRRKDGTEYPVEVSIRRVQFDRSYQIATVRNTTERKRAERALQRVHHALQTLSAGNGALVRATDEAALLKDMARILGETGRYPLVMIGYPMNDAEKTIDVKASFGIDPRLLQPPLSWGDNERGQTASARALRLGQTQLFRNSQSQPGVAPWLEFLRTRHFNTALAIPMRLSPDAAPFAFLSVAAAEADAFDDDEVRLINELATNLAYGVGNLRSAAARREGVEKLRLSLEGTIGAIGATMEARDPYTAGHQHRVATLAEAIASEMGLPASVVAGVRFGSLIHDVGKIQLPSEILAKPTRLTKLEYEMIKTHPQAGYDIVKDIEFPWPIAQMVLQHHERLDGSGYPQGLKGEDIILEARILAVADVVEAMSSHRPYRPSRGIDAALKEIEDKRSTQLDPLAVDACLKLFREEGYRLENR